MSLLEWRTAGWPSNLERRVVVVGIRSTDLEVVGSNHYFLLLTFKILQWVLIQLPHRGTSLLIK